MGKVYIYHGRSVDMGLPMAPTFNLPVFNTDNNNNNNNNNK